MLKGIWAKNVWKNSVILERFWHYKFGQQTPKKKFCHFQNIQLKSSINIQRDVLKMEQFFIEQLRYAIY